MTSTRRRLLGSLICVILLGHSWLRPGRDRISTPIRWVTLVGGSIDTPGSIVVVRGISAPRKTRHIPGNDTLSPDRYLNVARILLTALESSAAVYHAKGVYGRQCRRKSRHVPERARTREIRDRLALHGRHWALRMSWGEMSREWTDGPVDSLYVPWVESSGL